MLIQFESLPMKKKIIKSAKSESRNWAPNPLYDR